MPNKAASSQFLLYRPTRLFDEKGLYLEVAPSGGKWWRFKYRFSGKKKRLSLGVYSDVTLTRARSARDEARTLLADGVDPSAARKEAKREAAGRATNSLKAVAREWFAKRSYTWVASHSSDVLRRLEAKLFPEIGD